MPKIFVSYSRTNVEFALRLADSLTERGLAVWIDVRKIEAGADWGEEIQKGLNECGVMLLIVTPLSMESPVVRSEWRFYLNKGKRVIPIILEKADLPFLLNNLQYVDFSNISLSSPEYETAIERLYAALQGTESKSPPPRPRDGVGMPQPTKESLLTTPAAETHPSPRSLPWWMIAAVGIFVLVVIALILTSRDNTSPSATQTAEAVIAADTPTTTPASTFTPTSSATSTATATSTDTPPPSSTLTPTVTPTPTISASLVLPGLIRVIQNEGLAITYEDIERIRQIYTSDATIRNVLTDETWTDAPAYYQAKFNNEHHCSIAHLSYEVVEWTASTATVKTSSRGTYGKTGESCSRTYDNPPGSDVWEFVKDENGDWRISRFTFNNPVS